MTEKEPAIKKISISFEFILLRRVSVVKLRIPCRIEIFWEVFKELKDHSLSLWGYPREESVKLVLEGA